MFLDENVSRQDVFAKVQKRAKELVKGMAEEAMMIDRLNQLSLGRFNKLYTDLNEAEKDEIYNMISSPLVAQPPIKHQPTVNQIQPAGQTVGREQEVLKAESSIRDAKWGDIYNALRREGYSKERAAKIATWQRQRMKKEEAKDKIQPSKVMIDPEMTKPDPFTKSFNIISSPASESNSELADKYNELIDKANDIIPQFETKVDFMDREKENEDVFASRSKGGKKTWI